jgi:hypothetical protein
MAMLIISAAAVLLVSGCTIPGTDIEIPFISGLFGPSVEQDTTDVVVISSLRAIPDTVVPGQQFRIIAYVQNKGSKTFEKSVQVKLYDYCKGTFEILGNNIEKGVDGDQASTCTIEKLLPYETKEIYWTLKADKGIELKTVCPSDGMKVSVTYPYESTSLSTITFMEPTEYQRRIEQGTLQSKDSYIIAGDGPVRAYLDVEDEQPIPIDAKTTVLSLNIENRGSGYPVTQTSQQGDEYQVTVKSVDTGSEEIGNIYMEWKKADDCEIKTDGFKTKLIQDKRKFVCEANIMGGGDVGLESTISMETAISYTYQFTKSAKVTVEPKI